MRESSCWPKHLSYLVSFLFDDFFKVSMFEEEEEDSPRKTSSHVLFSNTLKKKKRSAKIPQKSGEKDVCVSFTAGIFPTHAEILYWRRPVTSDSVGRLRGYFHHLFLLLPPVVHLEEGGRRRRGRGRQEDSAAY